MTADDYARLLAVARRHTRRQGEARDLLNDALLAAMKSGRSPGDDAWIAGTIRNLARMHARTAVRRRRRDESIAAAEAVDPPPLDSADPVLARISLLPRGARIIALLAIRGMDRAEIASALGLSHDAL
jgi:RNA polymerase sigma-70 factor (ECF subfamily)